MKYVLWNVYLLNAVSVPYHIAANPVWKRL